MSTEMPEHGHGRGSSICGLVLHRAQAWPWHHHWTRLWNTATSTGIDVLTIQP